MSELLKRTTTVAALGLAVSLALGACTPEAAQVSQPSSSPSATADPDFPLTLVHSQGETVIDEVPARVVTTGMEQTDTLLALGVVPVATEVSFGYPWREEKLTELGATQPERLLPTERIDDALAQLEQLSPDLTIAGAPEKFGNALLADGYLRLNEVAPSLYPTDQALDPKGYPSGVSWRETLTQAGAALGKSAEAAAVLNSIDESLADYAAEHPEFAGKTIAVAGNSAGAFNVIEETAPMALVLKSLGFVPIDTSKIEHLDNKGIMSVAYLSPEQAAQIDVDVMLIPDKRGSYFDSDSGFGSSPTYANGIVLYSSTGNEDHPARNALRVSTALSIPWGIDAFVNELSEALK